MRVKNQCESENAIAINQTKLHLSVNLSRPFRDMEFQVPMKYGVIEIIFTLEKETWRVQ